MKKKILIVAKTYPTRSKKYTELVCTAGLDEEGNWYRIYPLPTKTLKEYKGLKKYTWIEAEITRDTRDPRPESHKINTSSIRLLDTIPTDHKWQYRKDIVLRTKIYESRHEIVAKANQDNSLSLCLFKPRKFHHVYFEKKEVEQFSPEEIKAYQNANVNLFEHNSACEVEFEAMPVVPYDFKLEFEDIDGKRSKMNILDWEISQLYWREEAYGKSDAEIKKAIRNKLNWMIDEREFYLYLGTLRQSHGWTSNPFTIIGLFYPPQDEGYVPSLFG